VEPASGPGEHEQATVCFRRALRLIRAFDDRLNEADILSHLGETQAAMGAPEPARRSLRQAIGILREFGHPSADELDARLRLLDPPSDAGAA
jgi:tetratricopeptide (TPR) repeat protein